MAEGTKCYQPDEFDCVCKVSIDAVDGCDSKKNRDTRFAYLADKEGYIDARKFAANFYAAVNATINSSKLRQRSFGCLKIQPNALHLEDKISRLKLKWNGAIFSDMNV